ncbi:Der GTPase-activating protein YihI [Shewanella eurypsychrophilus]|uniref:Der GTPase-activating protein YihI n=1 Tax=Shewanella eurypsychrophilus TaxID=2593656 RepID=A0ABX6V3F6_9GAMM|nr:MULTISPECIES: Der GTPase-activating protein YihI [Shewanella]QFU20500.1 Der GTPase-activating protein YihI [Shewanella sp. YLB-09]QFU20781.1 Der GTPase-activating protein YihI [Shewanella sp. YLB-09]QPG56076.1 Der GTPase-activating protein YihI [Shewanella eurypsychrophilus]
MSHSKKSRKSNENAPKLAPRTKKSDRVLEGKKQNTGNKAGSRHNTNLVGGKSGSAATKKDPRHGSKKAIALDLPNKVIAPKKEQGPKLTEEQKLLKLEEDPRLNQLLDMLEEGKELGPNDQKWLEKMLSQIEALMERLGISEEDDLDHVVQTTATSDDDLFDKFESGADLLKDYQNKD